MTSRQILQSLLTSHSKAEKEPRLQFKSQSSASEFRTISRCPWWCTLVFQKGVAWMSLSWGVQMSRLTLLTSCRSFSVISVFLGLSICPITETISCPPWGFAFAASRSCNVMSWTTSFFLWTSPYKGDERCIYWEYLPSSLCLTESASQPFVPYQMHNYPCKTSSAQRHRRNCSWFKVQLCYRTWCEPLSHASRHQECSCKTKN